ncbi:MAG: hypothetical protein L0H93_21070 [Nocardioides sp.]|nr:hypothetical protein [Nocardioides sp.]
MGTQECPTCCTSYVVDIVVGTALPGIYRTGQARVPVEDIFGRSDGNYRTTTTGGWVSSGPTVPVTKLPDDGGYTITYTWPCGDHTAQLQKPAYDRQRCRFCTPEPHGALGGRQRRCLCCGGNPTHAIARDPQLRRVPRCMESLGQTA